MMNLVPWKMGDMKKSMAPVKEKIKNKEEEIVTLDSKNEKELWKDELEEFSDAYIKEYDPVATKVSKIVPKVNKPVAIKIVKKK